MQRRRKHFLFVVLLAELCTGPAFASYKLIHGETSPFTGSEADLVTVHLHMNPITWNVAAHVFDNGSILIPNEAPKKGKGGKPCGATASYCVYGEALTIMGARRGSKQLMVGNEIAYLNSLMFKRDFTWKRLPGKLQITLYGQGYPLSGTSKGQVSSIEIDAAAGSEHEFTADPLAVSGGTTISITGK